MEAKTAPLIRAEALQEATEESPRRLGDIMHDLALPVPPSKLATKDTGRFKADYIPHTTVRDYLDHFAPGWEWRTRLFEAGGKIYVTGTLTIIAYAGDDTLLKVSRDGTGNEAEDLDGYGDPSSNAEAMALRRAAMAFGLGRDLWRKK